MSELTRKTFITEIKAVGERRRKFIISTSGVDRDNDTIRAAGWRLDSYKNNPVVLWAHDYSQLPLAKTISIEVAGDALMAIAEFCPADMHPGSETVLRMLDGGFLNATSVGFRPLQYTPNTSRGGTDFVEQELLEFSIVPVPANPAALVVGRGANAAAVAKWLKGGNGNTSEPVLDILDDDEPVLEIIDYAPPTRSHRSLGGDPLSDPFAHHDRFDVDPALLQSAIADSIAEQLRDAVKDGVRRAVLRARGRVD